VDRVASELGPSVKLMFMQSSGKEKERKRKR